MKRKSKVNIRRLTIKFLLSLVYLLVITILLVGSYKLFQDKKEIVPWDEVSSVDEYSYIDIAKMSEKFAYYENENIGLHFVIEEEDTGQWHTYVIAIDEDDYNKYKEIIDYSYDRTDKLPARVRVTGYPTIMSDELKKMILNNIGNFLPAENKVTITEENLEYYLTNSYLDTTLEKKDSFDLLLCVSLLLMFIMIILLIFTIFDKDKIVDNIDEKVEEVEEKSKRILKRK